MRAVRISAFGPLQQSVKVAELPKPSPRQGHVIVKILAAAVNPSDVKNATGTFHDEVTLPRTPGRDFAGVVVDGPSALINRKVFGTGGRRGWDEDGSHAQFISVPEQDVLPLPDLISLEQAAALGVPYITALSAIKAADVSEGKDVLIVGVRGAVGSAMAQLCKWKKARVIGAVRGKIATLPAKDADKFVDEWIALEEDSVGQLKKITLGGADVVLDTVGGAAMFEASLHHLKKRGVLVEISATGGATVSFNLQKFYRHELRIVGVNSLNQTSSESAKLLAEVVKGIQEGALLPPTKIRGIPLERAVEAYEAVGTGSQEKLVLLPHPDEAKI